MEKKRSLYSTDDLMMKTYEALLNDFSPYMPENLVMRARSAALLGIRGVRSISWPCAMRLDSHGFKCQYQLETFFKRYIFADDIYSEDSLKSKAYDDFIQSQATFGIKTRDARVDHLLSLARKHIAEILGPFSYTEWFQRAKFGKKAAVGLPLKDSYLDTRMGRIHGSRWQRNVWKVILQEDHLLRDATSFNQELNASVAFPELALTAVPKSWKACRTIAPDTVIGGYLSAGLGAYIRHQLEANTHIKLATAQDRHKELAREASLRNHLVTADLSKASDSFTWEHIKALLPGDWCAALRICRSPKVCVPEHGTIELTSFMLMGSGHTFPLQTLLFYGLLKAIADTLNITSKCYVYGDDLIYPRKMHAGVKWLFPRVGLTLNLEKTFEDGPFRESCGGDYHHGVDVRPHMPEAKSQKLDNKAYAAFLYKLLNGLRARWDENDIPRTIALLLTEVANCTKSVLIVPEDASDFSGYKGYTDDSLIGLPVSWPSFTSEGWVYGSLSIKSRHRKVERETPYYWEWLRSHDLCEAPTPYDDDLPATLTWVRGEVFVTEKGGSTRYRYSAESKTSSVWPSLPYYKARWATRTI